MRLQKKELSSYAKYQVEVSATSLEKSSLLKHGGQQTRIKRIFGHLSKAVVAMMIVIIAFTASTANAQPAQAALWGWDPVEKAKEKVSEGLAEYCPSVMGLSSEEKNILAPKPAPKGSTETMYERYGMSGASWSYWNGFYPVEQSITGNDGQGIGTSTGIINRIGGSSKGSGLEQWEQTISSKFTGLTNNTKDCLNGNMQGTITGNSLLNFSKVAVALGNLAFEKSSTLSGSIWESIDSDMEKIMRALYENLYFEYLLPMIMIASIYLGYVGLVKRQSTKFFQDIMWVIATIVATVSVMATPTALPKAINTVTVGIGEQVAESVTSIATSETGLCDATGKNKSIRNFQCQNYYGSVYRPWVIGQFGKSPEQLVKSQDNNFMNYVGRKAVNVENPLSTLTNINGQQLTIEQVAFRGNHVPTQQTWALYYLDHKSNWDNASAEQKINKNRDQLAVFGNQLGMNDYNRDFKGENGSNRVLLGLTSGIGAVASNAVIVWISLEMIALDIMLMLAFMLFPFVGLISLNPSFGRRIGLKYMSTILGLGIKRVVYSIYLATVVVVFQVMSTVSMDPIILLILLVIFAAISFKGKKYIDQMLQGVTLFGETPATMGGIGAIAKHANKARSAGQARLKAGLGSTASLLQKSKMGSVAGTVAGMKSAAETFAGAGKAPQQKQGAGGQSTKRTQNSAQGEAPTDEQQHSEQSSGAGESPQNASEKPETQDNSNYQQTTANAPETGSESLPEGNAGAGENPQEQEAELPPTRAQLKARRKVEKRENKELRDQLQLAGYRTRIPLSTFVGAGVAGMTVGLITGNSQRAHRVSAGMIQKKRNRIAEQNHYAVNKVGGNLKQHYRSIEDANRRNAWEADQERKREAREKAKRESAKQGQNPRNQAPQQKQDSSSRPKQSAPKVAVKPEVRTPQQMQENGKQGSAPQQKQGSEPTVKLPTPRSAESPVSDSKRSEGVKLPTPRPRAEKPSEERTGATKPSVKRTPPLPPRRERRNEPPVPNKGGANFRK